jgi:hypothetical protein
VSNNSHQWIHPRFESNPDVEHQNQKINDNDTPIGNVTYKCHVFCEPYPHAFSN